MGSTPGRDKSQSLKLVVVTFPLGTQDCGNSTTTGPPASGQWKMVKYWLKIVQETWICELSLLNNLNAVDTA